MQSGMIVGLFFVLQAISFLLYKQGIISSLLLIGGLIMVPVSLVLTAIKYRDRHLGGKMRYMEGVGYMMWTYLFALILAIVAFYISTRVLLNSPDFVALLEQSIEIAEQMMEGTENAGLLSEGMSSLTPQSFTLSFLSSSLFFGLIFIYIAGLFIKRR